MVEEERASPTVVTLEPSPYSSLGSSSSGEHTLGSLPTQDRGLSAGLRALPTCDQGFQSPGVRAVSGSPSLSGKGARRGGWAPPRWGWSPGSLFPVSGTGRNPLLPPSRGRLKVLGGLSGVSPTVDLGTATPPPLLPHAVPKGDASDPEPPASWVLGPSSPWLSFQLMTPLQSQPLSSSRR